LIPNGFALSFNGRDATDTRSELGARFDRVLAVYTNAVLALRGRVAWIFSPAVLVTAGGIRMTGIYRQRDGVPQPSSDFRLQSP
jgi:hypothetical protein